MKLYGSLTSPYVRKARILIQEKKVPCEFVVADAWAAAGGLMVRPSRASPHQRSFRARVALM